MGAEDIVNETLEDTIARLERSLEYANSKVSMYEKGDNNLYYSLQRKMNEISTFLNANNLATIDVEDKTKSFERIFLVLQKCETLAASAKAFGEIAGIVEKKEVKKPFVDTIADDRR